MSIIQRVPWTVQPQFPVPLDYSNPLVKGIEFLRLGSHPTYNPTGKVITRVGAIQTSVSSVGIGYKTNASSNYDSYLLPVASGGTGPWTLAAYIMPVSGWSSATVNAVGVCETPGAPSFDRGIQYAPTTLDWAGHLYDGATKLAKTGVVVTSGRMDLVIATTDGVRLYASANGVEAADVAVSNTGYNAYSSAEFCVGNASNNLASAITLFPLVIRTNTYWSLSMRKSFASNPWQIFQQKSRRIWVPGAGAGGAITIDCTVGNAAADGTKALLSLPITIDASVGNAVAAGTTATVTQAVTINTTLGNAVAAGVTAAIELGSDITVACSVGNAVAAGITAMVSLPISMNTTVGNASAAGITATITLGDPLHGFTQDQLDFLVTYMETNMTFPTAADITAAVYAGVIDGTTTFAESIRLHNAVLAGKVSGAGTGTEVFRDLADTKDRIVASVDGSGNRTAITRDAT